MNDVSVLLELGIVVVGATGLIAVGRRLGIPPILAYMLAGLTLGPVAGLLTVTESVELFSEIGVALLLFLVGLELSLERIRDIGRTAVFVGTLQVAVVLAGGTAIAVGFGFGLSEALVLGLATAFSSTVVVVKLLDRAGGLTDRYGRIAIGVLLVQDVLVAVVLTLAGGLGSGASGAGSPSVGAGLIQAFLGMSALVFGAVLAVRWVLPALFGWISESTEALFVTSLAWCFGFILAAEAMHVSVELGAFVAGVALAQLPESHELSRRVQPLVDLFLAVFFVALGAGMDLGGAAGAWLPALALSVFVLTVKPAVVAGLVGRSGQSRRTALLAGITLGQVSEFSFVLVALAVSSGLVGPEVVPVVGLMGLATIGASAMLVPRGAAVHRRLEERGLLRLLGGAGTDAPQPAAPSGHLVVVGMNDLGLRILRLLAQRGESVVAVDTDPDKLAGVPARTVVGDIGDPSVLEEAGVSRARLVISALRIEDANNLLAYRCSLLGVPASIHAFDPSGAHELTAMGADHLMLSKHDAARQIALALRREGVLA